MVWKGGKICLTLFTFWAEWSMSRKQSRPFPSEILLVQSTTKLSTFWKIVTNDNRFMGKSVAVLLKLIYTLCKANEARVYTYLFTRLSSSRARSIRPKIPVWISEIFVCRMERYFTPDWTDLVPFPLGHISRQDLLGEMLEDNDEVVVFTVFSAVSCFMRSNLTRIHDYFMQTFPRYLPDQFKHNFRMMKETCEHFSPEIMQTAQIPTGNSSERLVLIPEKEILAFCGGLAIKNRLGLWQIVLHPAVSTGRHLVALVEATFTAGGTRADSCRVEMPNGTENFRNLQISGKKDNLERLTEIFETSFRKLSVQFDFEPEFPEILVEWNAPQDYRLLVYQDVIIKTRKIHTTLQPGSEWRIFHFLTSEDIDDVISRFFTVCANSQFV